MAYRWIGVLGTSLIVWGMGCWVGYAGDVGGPFYQTEVGVNPVPDPPDQPPDCDECASTASPAYPGSGNAFWDSTDLSLNSRTGLMQIRRRYNSNDKTPGPFGYGWSFNFDVRLISAYRDGEHFFVVRLPNGRRLRFAPTADDDCSYEPVREEDLSTYKVQGRLMVGGEVGCAVAPAFPGAVTCAGGTASFCETRYFDYDAGIIYTFGSFGELIRITNPRGEITLTYTATEGLLERVEEDSGAAFDFTWFNGLIKEIGDHAGRAVTYDYDTRNNLVAQADPLGATTRYVYGQYQEAGTWTPYAEGLYRHKLAAVIDPLDRELIYFQYLYTNPDFWLEAENATVSNAPWADGRLVQYREGGITHTYEYTASGSVLKKNTACSDSDVEMRLFTSPKGEISKRIFVRPDGETWETQSIYQREEGDLKLVHYTLARDLTIHRSVYDLGQKGALVASASYRSDPECTQGGCYADGAGCDLNLTDNCDDRLERTEYHYVDRTWGNQIKYSKTENQPGHYYVYENEGDLDDWGNLSATYLVNADSTYTYDPNTPPDSTQGRRTGRFVYGDFGQMTKSCQDREVDGTLREVCTEYEYIYDEPLHRYVMKMHLPPNNDLDQHPVLINAYDNLWRLETSTDPLGNVTAYVHDALDRPITVTLPDPAGNTTSAFFTSYSYPSGPQSCTDADDEPYTDCRLVTQTDPNDLETHSFYDGQSRMIEQIVKKGGATLTRTAYAYGPYGLEKIKDANGNTISYDYDECHDGRLLSMTDNTRGAPVTTTYGYESGTGRLETVTAPRGTLTYTYDDQGRPYSRKYDPGDLEFITAYEPDTGLVNYQLENENDLLKRTTEYTYNASDHSLARVSNDDGAVSYGYTPDGQVKTMDYAATFGATTTGRYAYAYYPDGSVKSIVHNDGANRADYAYELTGAVKTRGWGTAETEYAYDHQGRLTSQVNRVNNQPMAAYAYRYDIYDPADGLDRLWGMRTGMTYTDAGGGIYPNVYGYDPLYRLTRVDYPALPDAAFAGQTHTFAYDFIGNRTGMTVDSPAGQKTIAYHYRTNGAGNSQLLESVEHETEGYEVAYSYNPAGDLVQKADTRGLEEDMAYDALGRLIQYYVPTQLLRFIEYDGPGNRVAQEDVYGWDHFTRKYLYANEDILFTSVLFPETVPFEDTAVFHGPGIDEPLMQESWNYSDGTHRRYALLADALGSVTGYWDELGGALTTIPYDAWGTVGNETLGGIEGPGYGYTGRELFHMGPPSAQLQPQYYFYRARYYEPGIGRFTQRDPIERWGSYHYSGNNPIMNIDPSGMKYLPCNEVRSIIGRCNTSSRFDTAFILCLSKVESTWDPDAHWPDYPKNSAWGLMGMTIRAAKQVGYNPGELWDPCANVAAGTRYLDWAVSRYGSVEKGVDKYGTGAGYYTKIKKCADCVNREPDSCCGNSKRCYEEVTE